MNVFTFYWKKYKYRLNQFERVCTQVNYFFIKGILDYAQKSTVFQTGIRTTWKWATSNLQIYCYECVLNSFFLFSPFSPFEYVFSLIVISTNWKRCCSSRERMNRGRDARERGKRRPVEFRRANDTSPNSLIKLIIYFY